MICEVVCWAVRSAMSIRKSCVVFVEVAQIAVCEEKLPKLSAAAASEPCRDDLPKAHGTVLQMNPNFSHRGC